MRVLSQALKNTGQSSKNKRIVEKYELIKNYVQISHKI